MISLATKLKIGAIVSLLGVTAFFVGPDLALAQNAAITNNCSQWQIDNGACGGTLRGFIQQVLNWFLMFLGLVATGFLVYGGFMYITSAGNDQDVEKAKKLIIYAGVGILVILVSAILVNALIGIQTDTAGNG
jgi:hypothetical protein